MLRIPQDLSIVIGLLQKEDSIRHNRGPGEENLPFLEVRGPRLYPLRERDSPL